MGKALQTLQYDPIGRLAQDKNPLGAFTISYLGATTQPTEREVNGANPTTWGYLGNTGDRRLASINNDNQAQYTLTTMPENLVTGVSVTRATAYPATGTETATYNNLNQLTSLSGQAFAYDADGNLLSDGTHDYTWDAANRLVGITFPAEPGQQVAFTYDGLGRRVEITSTPAGGSPATTTYTWCGLRPCIASNSDGTVARRYYAEGEQVLASSVGLYYEQDQIDSIRDVLVLPGNTTQAYAYDPYGNPLQAPTTGPLTDFRFAGMFFEPTSGPSLANALQLLASNPWLLALVLATEIAGGGPEELAADAVVGEEILAAEGTTGGAAATTEGASAAAEGALTPELGAGGGVISTAGEATAGGEEEGFNITFETEHAAPHFTGTGLSQPDIEA